MKPILIAIALSTVHVLATEAFFGIGLHHPVTCSVLNDKQDHFDEYLNSLMVIVIPILFWNKQKLTKYMKLGGTIASVLKPFIRKQDIIALNQIVQILIEVGY